MATPRIELEPLQYLSARSGGRHTPMWSALFVVDTLSGQAIQVNASAYGDLAQSASSAPFAQHNRDVTTAVSPIAGRVTSAT
jgi:hypothetical protein